MFYGLNITFIGINVDPHPINSIKDNYNLNNWKLKNKIFKSYIYPRMAYDFNFLEVKNKLPYWKLRLLSVYLKTFPKDIRRKRENVVPLYEDLPALNDLSIADVLIS